MKRKFVFLIFLIASFSSVKSQFFAPDTAGCTTSTFMFDGLLFDRLTIIRKELQCVAISTNSKVSYTFENLDTTKSVYYINNKRYTDSTCTSLKAHFSENLKATHQTWFDNSGYSDSIKINFEEQKFYFSQIEEIKREYKVVHLSSDTITFVSESTWRKTQGEKKVFLKKIIVLNEPALELKIRYIPFDKRHYGVMKKRIRELLKAEKNN